MLPLSERRRRRRRSSSFNLDAKRRREIERHARHIGAAVTEDFDRWLIAWAWHNEQSTDPVVALQNAACVMGGKLSDAEAKHILEQANATRRRRNADSLGTWLGLKHVDRERLRITTVGSKDVGKQARKELRKRADRLYREKRRRAQGARPRAEYEATALSWTKPWSDEGISRRTWERRRNKMRDASPKAALDASPSAALFNSHTNDASASSAFFNLVDDGPASAGTISSSVLSSTSASLSSRTATLPAAERLVFRLRRHPRDKLCGEAETPKAIVFIREVWPPALGPPGDDVFDIDLEWRQ